MRPVNLFMKSIDYRRTGNLLQKKTIKLLVEEEQI